MEIFSGLVFLPILFIISMFWLKPHNKELFSWISTFVSLLVFILLILFSRIPNYQDLQLIISKGKPFEFFLQIDSLSLITSIFCSIVWFCSSLFSIYYFRQDEYQKYKRYNIFSLLNFVTILFIFMAGNMITFFIFFEILLVVSYVLIIHYQTKETFAAGIKYLFFQIIGGMLFLFAIILTYAVIKTTNFFPGGYAELSSSILFSVIFWFYVIGLSIKAGLFPLHIWLPEAHPVAPSPASALLSGMVIKTGTFGLMRVFLQLFGIQNLVGKIDVWILLLLAIFTMFWGSAIAIGQTHLKRVLAYSSVSQIGYVIMGIALLSPLGLLGAILHTLGHAIVKSLLFLSAGSMIEDTGEIDVTRFDGYGVRNPIVFSGFTVGALSMIGFPFFVNFITKWTLGVGIMESFKNQIIPSWILGIALTMLLLSSLLNAIYYAPIIIRGWFYPQKSDVAIIKFDFVQHVPLIILMLLVVGLFFSPSFLIQITANSLKSLIPLPYLPNPF